nr:MAG TPA: hypothetical protein [Caudoviricetes sp.]
MACRYYIRIILVFSTTYYCFYFHTWYSIFVVFDISLTFFFTLYPSLSNPVYFGLLTNK